MDNQLYSRSAKPNSIKKFRGNPGYFIIILFAFFISGQASGQTLGQYTFNSAAGATCVTMNKSVTTQPTNASFSVFSNVNSTCVNSTTGYITTALNTTAAYDYAEYHQFTITPNAGYLVTLSSLTFVQRANAALAGSSWELRSDANAYASAIGSGSITTVNQTPVVTLPAATFANKGAVVFRLYVRSVSASTTQWIIDNLSVNGTVNQIPANPTNPTSNSPQCPPGVTLTRATPPAGVTWYWQTTSTDTSKTNSAATYVASTSGTYYLRARNNTSFIWSTGTGSAAVVVRALVGPTSFTGGSTSTRCQGSGTSNYPATATNTTGITYSLDAASVTGGNSINSSGTVTWAAGWAGPTTTITATAAGCPTATSATHTVTITPTVGAPVFTLGASSVRCRGAGLVTYTATATNSTGITYSLDNNSLLAGNSIDPANGQVTYVETFAGTAVITASAAGCNGPRTSTHTVTVTQYVQAPVFALTANSSRCQGAATVSYSATATYSNPATLTYSLDAASIAAGNSINASGTVSYAAGYAGTSYITATAQGCSGPVSSVHTAVTNPSVTTPVFAAGATSVRCQGAGVITYNATATVGTIAYSLNAPSLSGGNTINATTGEVTYNPAYNGTTIITATATGCSGPRSTTHTVTVTPTVSTPAFSAGATSARCIGSNTVTYAATAANSTSIIYELDAASIAGGNTIDAASGAVTYSATWSGTAIITATAQGCNGPSATVTHSATTNLNVTTPVFADGSNSTRCQGAGSYMYTATADYNTTITYSLNPASITGGNTINSTNGLVTWAAGYSGTTIITVSAAGCAGPTTATHTVTVTPSVTTPVFTAGATSTRCIGAATITYTANASNNTGIIYSLDNASISADNFINSATGAVTFDPAWTGVSIVTATASGCNGPRTATHTITTNAAVTQPVFAMGASSFRCKVSEQITYTASAGHTTGITYTLDGVSLSNGNTIVAATGRVTWSSGWTGNSTITATATGCYGPVTQTHIVRTRDKVDDPEFVIGDKSVRCQAAGTITYTATEPNAWTITYEMEASGLAGGNTINATTGAVTFAAGYYGKFKIKAYANGCEGPKTKEHEIETIQSVMVPVFTMGSTSTRCQAADDIKYEAKSDNANNLVFTLDATSRAAGNTIKSDDGTVDFVAGWSGISVITATATGTCNSPVSSTHTVTTLAPVGTPVFDDGNNTTRCQGANTHTYSASATSNTGLTYALDATSRGAGNTINTASGLITWVAGWTGVSTVTATATGCVGPRSSTHTITTTPTVGTPVFTIGASSIRCQAASTVTYTSNSTNNTGITYTLDDASLAFGNTIDAATGAVTYLEAWTGTSVITSTATGCNGPASASHTVSTTPYVQTPVFALGSNSNRCQALESTSYTATAAHSSNIVYTLDAASLAAGNTINAGSGVVSYRANYVGTSYITATANGCGPSTVTVHTAVTTATVGLPVFVKGAGSGICQGSIPVTYTASATTTSGITYSLDATSLANGNTINTETGEVTYAPTWFGATTVTATAQGCGGPRSANHVVQVIQTVGFPIFNIGATSTRCQANGTVTYTANAVSQTGMSYALDQASLDGGNTINPANGAVTYVASWTGTSIITATATGCSGPKSSIHTVSITPYVTVPVFDVNSIAVRCQGPGTLPYVATAQYTTGITYSVSGGAGVTVNPSTGDVTFSSTFSGTAIVTASAAGCSGPRTATFSIYVTPTVGTPTFALGASSSRCHADESITYTATATTNTGIAYSLDAASIAGGNSIDAATGTVTYVDSWRGTSTITATAEGCNGPVSFGHTVTTNESVTIPVFVSGSNSIRCQGATTVTYNATAQNTTGITYTLDLASRNAGNTIVATTGAVTFAAGWSGTSIVTASAAGCYGPLSDIHTITITPTVGTPVFDMGATSSICQASGTITYSATATTSTGITYSLNAASVSAGNIIDAVTGAVTYHPLYSGTTVITAIAAGCNGPATATHTAVIRATVGTPVFSLGGTSVRCQANSTVTYTANATTNTGITYTLDQASIDGGLSINPTSGAVTYVASWTGSSIVTATAAGCNGPTSSSHTVSTTPYVTVPVFDAGAVSLRCQGAASLPYTATAQFATGITYSIGGGAGISINSSTGIVTFTASYSGSAVVTASAAGCSGPRTATFNITVTPTVSTPVFSMGSTSSRCHAAGSVTYSATAAASTSIAYSLDDASITGGNSIDAVTGRVTYVDSWEGISVITATAQGCNGPRTATHTVTNNASVVAPVFALGTSSVHCQAGDDVYYTATAANSTNISYSLDANSRNNGNSINGQGRVRWDADWVGTSTVTATASGCYGPVSSTHTIITRTGVGTPIFAAGSSSTICQASAPVTYGASASNTTGITYNLSAASLAAGNTIDAATGRVTYNPSFSGTSVITAVAAGCYGPRSANHTVTVRATVGTPAFNLGASSTRCQGGNSVTYTASATTSTGMSYSLDAYSLSQGNLINSGSGVVTWSSGYNGTATITATATGCNGPTSNIHTVTITPTVGTPVFDLGATSTRCRGAQTFTFSATASNTTGITYSLDLVTRLAGNTINAATGAVTFTSAWSGTSTITASAAGCNGPDVANHVVSTANSVATPTFALGTTSTRCQGANSVIYTAAAAGSTSITYSLDANSISQGNSINAANGTVTYAAGWSGTSVITAVATGCGGPTTANHTVTTTASVAAPTFAAGSSSSRCNGAGTVSYTASAATTVTYTIDAASIAAGNTINSSTGVLTYVTGYVGTTTITATAAGCGSSSATHLATSTPSVAKPVFGNGVTSTRCQRAQTTSYSSTAANSTSITYSLDAESITAGNTINTATGAVTFVSTWTGPSTITASAVGCNGPATSTHVVTSTPNGTPTFTLGTNSLRMQGDATVTYTATANNGASVSYSLDAASIAAGNTINAATGAVTYTESFSGTSIITATAAGCNGDISTQHSVTTNPSSVFKHLYLSNPAQVLDRIDPVATADATTAVTTAIANGGSSTFTQSTVLCSPLTIKIGRNITVTNYLTITSGTMPANPNITAVLRYGATNIVTLTNPVYSSATGLLTWTRTLASDVTVPAGQAITLVVTSAQAGVTFTIQFDSQTKPSKIELPVSTFIAIESMNVYNAAYPGGTVTDGGVAGATYYIRAVVSDPFGVADITGMTFSFNPGGTTVNATSVATAGCNRIYEYVWNSPAASSYVDITGIAKEGFENTVTDRKLISFSNCTNCPPRAVTDSAVGAGGTPVIVNVLANDSDPNNNLNPASLAVVVEPQNGNAIIANGKIVYLPNGTFAGVDSFTYRICDLTSPTPLCATAKVYVVIDPTIVDACGEASLVHTYYIPYPEQDARTALIASTSSGFLPIPSNNIRTIISIKVPYPGMVLTWDHWEDGYETNIAAPVQTTTLVWGDGNPYNGIAPGYSNDIIPAGGSLVFDNTMPSAPRVAANIFYDGRDKIQATGELSVSQVLGEPSIIGLQSMKTNVTSTSEFGKSFTIPVGQDFNSQDFRYTALFIRASENNTEVNIDKDNNGTFETTANLNEGQSLLVNGGVLSGATVTGSAPIGVDVHFGGVDGYSSREVQIFPATWYSSVYYTPVPTTKSPDTAVVMLYNNLNRSLSINWTSGAPANGTINLPPKTVVRFPLALSSTRTYKFVNPTGESFTAIEVVDSYTPNGGGNSGSTFDWAFNLIAEDRLTTFATIAWAPGSTDGTRNDNPIWVTPATNTTIYVKNNGDVLTGGTLSPCGFRYDVSYTLNALNYRRVLDNTDRNQGGIAIFTCDGTKIAAVYGEDPSSALDANPSWDVGTTIKPYCAQKLLFANEDYAYTLTDRAVTIPVLNNDAGFTAVIDPSTLTVTGLTPPKHGTVSVNSNGTLLYTPNPSYIGQDTVQYRICSTPLPVCDQAFVIIQISGCPAPANQNIISGRVFLDKNKDGISNDGGTGITPAKVYFYADGNCNGTIDVNELKDSVSVDSSGSYQFITYPERTIADNFNDAAGNRTCATGSDGSTAWATNWVDAGDPTVGFCVTPAQVYANTDVEMITDGAFGPALRLKDLNRSATRTVNISSATAAFLSFSYRRAAATLAAGEDVFVQLSTNGSAFTTVFTISGTAATDAAYVKVENLNILPYASATTYIRFLTNAAVDDNDEVFIDDVSVTFLKYPMCYITAVEEASIASDYYISTARENSLVVNNGGTCLFPFDYGLARRIITVSGVLYNDANGLTDNLVNGTATGAPSGNTVYAYLVDANGKVEFKTTVNSLTGAYSFTRAEVSTTYTLKLSTQDVAVGATPPASALLPTGWVSVGDSFGLMNNAGTGNQTGVPDLSVTVTTGLFNVTAVNFGIERRPTAGSGSNTAINPPGTGLVAVPANTFSNIAANTDVSPGSVSSIRLSAFPTSATSISVNGISYTALTFPAAGIVIPSTSTGQPTQPILVDPVNGMVRVIFNFYAIDNAGVESSLPGTATLQLLIDSDRDGIADNNDIDDDNDGITDIIELCGNGATSFSCAPGGIDPAQDSDNDGIVNWQDANYGTFNANGANAALDRDNDGIPDHLDLDSDNDGVPDVVEAYGADANGDGVIDNFTDTDGDGLSQNVDANNSGAASSGNGLGFIDLDGDGFPNSRDLDSDNDGIPDVMEAGGLDINFDGRIDGFADDDSDGFANSVDGDANFDNVIENPTGPLLITGPALSNGRASSYPNKNADYTSRPNAYDLDSDGDGITDVIEAGFSGSIGISNGQVSGSRTNGWANSVQNLGGFILRNTDGGGPVNYLDVDSDDDGLTDNIEAQSTGGYVVPTDADTDNDGIANVYDINPSSFGGNGLTPYDNDGDGTPDYMDADADNDGAMDINEASRYFDITPTNINLVDTDGDGLVDEFDALNITSLTAGNIFRNVTNSNFGPLGNYSGPLPSGSNAQIVKSDAKMNDRDWRNIVVLPTQLVSFNGVYQNNIVTLKWSVQNETDVDKYEVERSVNGIEFSRIGSQPAVNRTSHTYSYTDDITTVDASYVYYRLRQYDKDGTSFTSQVIKWKIDRIVVAPVLYPNPVQDDLKIKYQSLAVGPADVVVFDGGGQTILTTKFNLLRGQNILTIPRLGSLNKGIYTLRFQNGSNTWTLRFVVQ